MIDVGIAVSFAWKKYAMIPFIGMERTKGNPREFWLYLGPIGVGIIWRHTR